ncbi:histidine kinase N-terminal 7TM domain-containing protein [Alkaliphilus serpentinus]|uniref:Circadian input-output histidine kinase CikA n=1 Tax=Alkaliphilus serpentinus TaxID=1482731 RepID=A0A833HM25_9FIRM|nr:histidine kinase N-terminal 7TM domain-containing protein [Alkaliphilus serpentinus]KAB3527130.1 response regulator [Alkaliphilus serpentinus]
MGIYVSLSIVSIVVALALVWQIRVRFSERGSYKNFTLIMLAVAFWTLVAMLEVISLNSAIKIQFSKLGYFGAVSVPVLFLFFSYEYEGKDYLLKRRWMSFFWIIPTITLALVMTNELHGLIWNEIYTQHQSGKLLILHYGRGHWYLVNTLYGYTLCVIGVIRIIITLKRSKGLKDHYIVILGILAPLVGNVLYQTRMVHFDYAPPTFAFMCICFAWAIISGFFEKKMAVAETIYEHLEEAIFLIDKNEKIISMNPYAAKVFKMKYSGEVIAAKGFFPFWGSLEGNLKKNMDELFEVSLDKTGETKWFSVHISSIGNNTKYPGWIVSMFDVTDKKLYQEELEKERTAAETANVAKSHFLANISHEIRTPLNGIMGFTEILAGTNLNQEQTEYLKEIKNASHTLYHLVNEVLDFSKIEAGKMELEKIDFSLSELVLSAVSLVKHDVKKKGVHLSSNIEVGICDNVKGDFIRLKQVLNNLVGNAVKFTEKGEVHLAVIKLQENDKDISLRFEVADTGVGISADAQKKLFEVFTQADNSTTRKYGGTGLGLSIAKRIIELMGGKIFVESEEGKGSRFSFEVELERSQKDTIATRESVDCIEEEIAAAANRRILLVEDIESNRKLASIILNRLGYTCDIAVNGKEAVEACSQRKFDLILMDCQMPVMDGYSATGCIRSQASLNNNTPIVAMTANALVGDREKCLAVGMDDFITKPINKDQLKSVIEKWCN